MIHKRSTALKRISKTPIERSDQGFFYFFVEVAYLTLSDKQLCVNKEILLRGKSILDPYKVIWGGGGAAPPTPTYNDTILKFFTPKCDLEVVNLMNRI